MSRFVEDKIIRSFLDDRGAIVVRLPSVSDGGVTAAEIALTTPSSCKLIARIRSEVRDATVGAGSRLSPRSAVESGRLDIVRERAARLRQTAGVPDRESPGRIRSGWRIRRSLRS